MQIVFINYQNYITSSGVHIHFIANELTRMGHECVVVVPEVKNTNVFGTPEYAFRSFEGFAVELSGGRYNSQTIFHAWTPRETARIPTLLAAQALDAPYFVHLEDNERRILESYCKKPFRDLLKDAADGVDFSGAMSHPILHQAFIAEANGVSVIMDRLAEFVPSNVPTQVIWPACERGFFRLPQCPDMAMREKFGIPRNAVVLLYPGNVHAANAETVSQLYRALPLVEAAGREVRLLRCAGRDDLMAPDVARLFERYVIARPGLPSRKLLEWIGMANVLVQPGSPDEFDEFRFPSKLPLFLASARPVILPRSNIGRFLTDGENCRILEENTPEKIAENIVWLLDHPAEAAAIGHNGRKFAAQNFNWQKTAKKLLDFYAANSKKRTIEQ